MRRAATFLAAPVLALAGCADPYNERPPVNAQTVAQQPTPAAPPPYMQDAPDAGDRAEVRRNRARPAFQELPYRTSSVTIDYVDERDGKVVLLVAYTGSRPHARAVYRRFLVRAHDRPANYIVYLQAVKRR